MPQACLSGKIVADHPPGMMMSVKRSRMSVIIITVKVRDAFSRPRIPAAKVSFAPTASEATAG